MYAIFHRVESLSGERGIEKICNRFEDCLANIQITTKEKNGTEKKVLRSSRKNVEEKKYSIYSYCIGIFPLILFFPFFSSTTQSYSHM